MSKKPIRSRGEAFSGKGHGRLRLQLLTQAGRRIKSSISAGYFCEAIAICESIICDRLESRLSFLTKQNVGFQNLGTLIPKLNKCETDQEMLQILKSLDAWRKKRNRALHELVKIADDEPHTSWDDRMLMLQRDAKEGFELVKWLYNQVADLNPLHSDRVFERPARRQASIDGPARSYGPKPFSSSESEVRALGRKHPP